MRRDATRLRADLVAAPVAGRVRQTVLDSAAGRGRGDRRLVLALVAALALGVVMLPVLVGVRWVDRVASGAAAPEPPPPWGAVGGGVVAIALGVVAVRAGPSGPSDGLPE